ncbi:hypothetical protein Fcan01_16463 [Folsomia candida]|uniref:Uncharacterized protein n=1 Tax=Folsomia candida TaxID=158441 RepID=A0A226DW12_FOLCA|nr:hypothetical protein Fcan01_16463 [Folsomia candida]
MQCILTAIYCTAMFLNICIGPLPTSRRLQGFAVFMATVSASILKWNYSIDIAPIQIVNAFLDFEERIMSDLPTLRLAVTGRAIKVFLYLLEISLFTYPIFVFLLLRFLPCTPPFILSMFATCGRTLMEETRH